MLVYMNAGSVYHFPGASKLLMGSNGSRFFFSMMLKVHSIDAEKKLPS